MLKIIFKHEWLSLLRNRFLHVVLALVIAAGLYGIHYGSKTIRAQKKNITFIKEQEQEYWQKALENFQADTSTLAGKQAYQTIALPGFARARHSRYAIFEPNPLAALSLGQRDMFAYAIPLSAQSLYIQLFRDEISNPLKLLSGNFDLAFVFIYLFPLLLIALGYQLLSVEQEQGTFPLLRLHAGPFWKIILIKLFFYYLLATMLVLFLSVVGFWSAGVPITENWPVLLIWVGIILLYCLFWMVLIFLVISFNQRSAFNAISLLGFWLLFLIIIPSVLNIVTALQHPIAYTHLSNIIRRASLKEGATTMDSILTAYYAQHPEYKPPTAANIKFKSAKGYAAFNELSDAQAGGLVKTYQQQLLNRLQGLNNYAMLNPAVSAQQLLNTLAHTDATDFIYYQQALVPYHAQIRSFFYTRLFTDKTLINQDYAAFPKFRLKDRQLNSADIIETMTQLSLLISLFGVFGAAFYVFKFD